MWPALATVSRGTAVTAAAQRPAQPDTPVLDGHRLEELRAFARALSPGQLLWASGYLAGLEGAGTAASPLASTGGAPRITLLYGSQTGTGAALARRIAERATALGFVAEAVDMQRYRPARLRQEQNLLVIVSTHGDGEPPDSARELHHLFTGPRAPRLDGIRFAVLALGDASYPRFCQTGREFDAALAAAGADRLLERTDCDVDYTQTAGEWAERILKTLGEPSSRPVTGASPAPAPVAASWTRHHPFAAPMTARIPLTASGSSREVWHVELDLSGSELRFVPGDSLSVVPENPRNLVERLLDRLGLEGSGRVTVPRGEGTLEDALVSGYEITRLTRPVVERYAAAAGPSALDAKIADSGALSAWMEGRNVLDLVTEYPVGGLSPQAFLGMLRVLPARRYSAASSLLAFPDAAHLAVAPVRWAFGGRTGEGLASSLLGRHLATGAHVRVFLEGQGAFPLPEDPDRPIILIGAGTGVAPYRAFLQEREMLGARGRNWLFFGDRNLRTDFLYQREWLQWLDDGLLTGLDVAFSRDGGRRVYVQDRLRERGREVYAWLEEGAAVYVCGSVRMGQDVHQALAAVLCDAGGRTPGQAAHYIEELVHTGRYHRDVY